MTVDQCTLDAEAFTETATCEETPSSGFDKSVITPGLPMIDVFLNKTKRANLVLMEEIMKNLTRSSFPMEDIGKNFSSLFNLLWNSNLPCFNNSKNPTNNFLLKKCMLYGKEQDCSKLFKPVPTDSGICCSFNQKDILKETEFSKLLKVKQNRESENETLYHAEIGVNKGLQLFVDQHSNRVTAGSVLSSSKYVERFLCNFHSTVFQII